MAEIHSSHCGTPVGDWLPLMMTVVCIAQKYPSLLHPLGAKSSTSSRAAMVLDNAEERLR